MAAGIAAAAMIALGVGIGYIVWGSTATAAVKTRSALPANPARPELPKTGLPVTTTQKSTSASRGFLGVEVSGTSAASSTSSGARVLEVVAGSPAAKAGIVAGDTITSFATRTVVSSLTLEFDTTKEPPGTKVKVGWTTATGKHESATVTLAKRPAGGTSVG